MWKLCQPNCHQQILSFEILLTKRESGFHSCTNKLRCLARLPSLGKMSNVSDRNQTLFCPIFWGYHHVWHAVASAHTKSGTRTHFVNAIWYIYGMSMSPALCEGLTLLGFKLGDVLKIGVLFNFYQDCHIYRQCHQVHIKIALFTYAKLKLHFM